MKLNIYKDIKMKKVLSLLLCLSQLCFVSAKLPGHRPRATGEDQLRQPITRVSFKGIKRKPVPKEVVALLDGFGKRNKTKTH